MKHRRPRLALLPLACAGALLAACRDPAPEGRRSSVEQSAKTPETIAQRQPAAFPSYSPERNDLHEAAPPLDPLAKADDDMRKVLEHLAKLGGKPIPSLTPEEARKQPTPADAVKAVLAEEGEAPPAFDGKTEDRTFAGADGTQLPARIYTPKADAEGPLPVVLYFHGGGFVIADIDTYDASARALADASDAIVVSADYARAPEHPFPAAHEDAVAAYRWVLRDAASFGGDPARVAVAGESDGGNLAANVAIAARDRGLQRPVHQLLVYPVAQADMETESYQAWRDGKPLDRAMMKWFVQQETRTPAAAKDPRLDLVNARLEGLPPATIVLAEIDPLRSGGELLAERLRTAGVPVESRTYEGVTHEFFGMGAVVADARDAVAWAGSRLDDAFDEAAAGAVPRQ
jgi:acetyl esterase/lipase